MKFMPKSRIEHLLAKIAGREIDTDTLVPAAPINCIEELLAEIAEKLADVDEKLAEIEDGVLPAVTAADNGKVPMVVNGKWEAAVIPESAEQ